MTAQPHWTDNVPETILDAPRVRPAVRDIVPSAPVPVRPVITDPSGFGFAEPAIQHARASVPDRRSAPKRPPRWPHIAAAIVVPAAGVAGFLAVFLSSTIPFQILTYAVIGGVVIAKVAGPVRAILAAIAAVADKIGPR